MSFYLKGTIPLGAVIANSKDVSYGYDYYYYTSNTCRYDSLCIFRLNIIMNKEVLKNNKAHKFIYKNSED
ncbi:putative membrane domain protein [Clostridioides difficile DA00165]|nr:putative membrane domain protein [Clostridioides difficile DA00165]